MRRERRKLRMVNRTTEIPGRHLARCGVAAMGMAVALAHALLSPHALEAQGSLEARGSQGVLGLRVGVNASALSTEDDRFVDMTPRKGLVAGAYLEMGAGAVAFRPELLFSQKGGTFDAVHAEHRDYLEAALLVVARMPDVADVRPFLAAGPTLSACRDGCGSDRSADLGSALAVGVARAMGRIHWSLEARHTRGFGDYLYDRDRERRHRVWSLSAGAGLGVY